MDGGAELPHEPVFPAGWGERAAWNAAGARGVRFAPLSPALERLFVGWVHAGHALPASALMPGVFRTGALVAKFFPPPSGLRRWTSPDTARRAAELALSIRPVAAPRPLLAVGAVGPERAQSLLVSEFVRGPTLVEAWERDARARAALPDFLASMHQSGVHHGDLHPGNLLWDGARLVLIDVTAVRRGLHLLRARRLVLYQWARLVLYLGDIERLRPAFERYAALRGWSAPEAGWRDVLARTRALMRRRARLPHKAPVLS